MTALLRHLEDGVLTLTLNRPAKRNAVNAALLRSLEEALTDCARDDRVRVVVVRGVAGCFCSGADVGDLASYRRTEMREFHDLRERALALLEALPCPTVAVVEGFALGTGLELALSTDMRLAAEDARFGVPSARLGVTESYGYTARLVRCVGLGRATFLMLSGARVTAGEAREMGLVERTYPAAELEGEAAALIRTLAANAPLALRRAKQVLRECWEDPRLERVSDPAEPFVASAGGGELAEGTNAFLGKRPARFGPAEPG